MYRCSISNITIRSVWSAECAQGEGESRGGKRLSVELLTPSNSNLNGNLEKIRVWCYIPLILKFIPTLGCTVGTVQVQNFACCQLFQSKSIKWTSLNKNCVKNDQISKYHECIQKSREKSMAATLTLLVDLDLTPPKNPGYPLANNRNR